MTRKLLLSLSTAFTLAFATAVTVTAVAPTAAVAQQDVLAAAFEGVGNQGRRKIQESMSFLGFYSSAVDGKYGPGTRRALLQTAAYVQENSRQQVRPDLSTAAGARFFMGKLASGEWDKWLWGDGDECDGC